MEQIKKKTTPQDVEDRLIDFASSIIDLVEAMPKSPAGKHLGGQILRSGTSPALNYGEAQAAESRDDFIHKMKLAAKETDETEYWLLLCNQISFYPTTEKLLDTCNSIHKILSKIISTSKKSLPNYQTTKLSN